MNLYFWLFSLCAVLSVPIRIHVSARLGREVRYRMRMQAAGLPVVKKKTEEERTDEETVDSAKMAKRLFALDGPLVFSLLREGHLKRAMHALRVELFYVHARLSFENAALTAMSYAAVRTFLQTALLCLHHPPTIQGRVEMDFRQQGSEVFVRCILSARLGSLLAAALRLFAAILRIRARLLTKEEENYAAASH